MCRIDEGIEVLNLLNFKKCPNCGIEWALQKDFLFDSDLQFVGYQANFEQIKEGLFLFNHSCGSTIALTVESVENIYNGQVYERQAVLGDDCPDYCLYEDNFEICPIECECAYIREIMQILKTWPKK